MPARNKQVRVRRKKRTQRKRAVKRNHVSFDFAPRKIAMYLAFLVLIGLIAIVLKTPSDNWNSVEKLGIVYPRESGEVEVAIFDPRLKEITRVVIPPNTEVTAAYQLGVWRTKSLWQLGQNEELGGRLLSSTVTNHLAMPTIGWADETFSGFVDGNTRALIKAVLQTNDTNLTFKDRLYLAYFTTKVHNTGYEVIDLADTAYLRPKKLEDGTDGYTTYASLPQQIAAVFSANAFIGREVTVSIKDATGSMGISSEIGQSIETLGAKVASVTAVDEDEVDCVVKGEEDTIVSVFVDVFECDTDTITGETNFDVEITLGTLFLRRF